MFTHYSEIIIIFILVCFSLIYLESGPKAYNGFSAMTAKIGISMEVSMRCVEMINLRSVNLRERDHVIDLIGELVPERVNHLESVKWFIHGQLETDLSIQLVWDDGEEKGISPLGQRLIRLLENYGLVSHYMWIESGVLYTADGKETV